MDNNSFSKIIMEDFDKVRRSTLCRTHSVQNECLSSCSTPQSNGKYQTATPTFFQRWKSSRRDPRKHVSVGYESPVAVDDVIFLDSYEETANRPDESLSVTVCREMIHKNLIDLMKIKSGNVQILFDIENGKVTYENVNKYFENTSKSEKNIGFLWTIFLKRKDLVDFFLQQPVDLNFHEPRQGFGLLHLSAFTGCVHCTQSLINMRAEVNKSWGSYTPLQCAAFGNSVETAKLLLRSGAKLHVIDVSGTDRLCTNETALQSAIRARAQDCIQLFLNENADVNLLVGGINALHVAADLGYHDCLSLLLNSGRCDPNTQSLDRKYTPLHFAAEGGFVDCVKLLLDHKANPSITNYRSQTSLHLAAKVCVECVQLLLKDGKCDSNALDTDNRTPLHVAVSKSESEFCFEVTEVLIENGSSVNNKDKYGYTPLHIAALNELSDCVDTLIYHGADVCAKTKGGTTALGIISRKIPASLSVVNTLLNESLMLNDPEVTYKEISLQFNFRYLLNSCNCGEMSFLQTFVDEGQKDILEHPLCSAFLYLKWQKIRKYYIARLIFCFIYVLLISVYVLTALSYQCYNEVKFEARDDFESRIADYGPPELCVNSSWSGKYLRQHPIIIDVQWFVLAAFTIIEIIRKVYGMFGCISLRKYFTEFSNIAEVFVLSSVFIISFIYTGKTYAWQNHVGAFSVLFGWANLMVMIGHLPMFGTYVTMYTRVQKEFSKLFFAYICVLIGFSICFCVIFPRSQEFTDPFTGFIKILVMMTGELDFNDLKKNIKEENSEHGALLELSAHIVFALFLIFITVILMNLLVGIAVHDIHGLKRTAGLSKLVDQTHLITQIELALFHGRLPSYFAKFLRWTALVSPSAYRVVITVKPLNPREDRLPQEVMRAALELCKQRKPKPVSRNSTQPCLVRRGKSVKSKCSQDADLAQIVRELSVEVTRLRHLVENNRFP